MCLTRTSRYRSTRQSWFVPLLPTEMSPRDLYYECLDEVDARQCSIPTLSYTINMQERYAVVRLTIEEFTCPVHTPLKTFSPYCDSDEESDCLPPTPTNTKATEKKIDDSSKIFIEALSHLEWQSIASSCPMGLPIKFEMRFHMTCLSISSCNSLLNTPTRGSVEQQ